MSLTSRIAVGCEAGVLAGASVIALFFLQDLISLQPLSTPGALAGRWFGPTGLEMDLSLFATVTSAIGYGFRLLAFTLFHFLAFMSLGVVATLVLDLEGSWLASVAEGGVFGLSACTLVYFAGAFVSAGSGAMATTPSVISVLGANLLAGLVFGGFLHWSAAVRANEV